MAYTPVNGNRNGRVLLTLLLAAIIAVAAVFGGYLWGHHTATAAAGQSAAVDGSAVTAAVPTVPAGPARIVGGIPSGFSHDRNGAIAAGIGFLQAVASVDAGMTKVTAVRAQALAANPSATVIKQLTDNGYQDGTASPGFKSIYYSTPLAVKVVAVSAGSAQLSFWECLTGGDSTVPGNPAEATTTCNAADVALSWEKGDWKVADFLATNGDHMSVYDLVRNKGYLVLAGAYTVLTVSQP